MKPFLLSVVLLISALKDPMFAQVAVRGETVYTMAGAPILNGVVLIRNGKIERVGAAGSVVIPAGYRTISAKVVTPGLVDVRSALGLSGYLVQPHDQDQVERSSPMQPELRAMDAYNPREALLAHVRSYGVTTVHTGHSTGILVSGQTMVVKTTGNSVEEAILKPEAMVAATLGSSGLTSEAGKSPGSRAKAIAMLRAEFLKAQEFDKKKDKTRDLRTEAFVRVLKGELPFLVQVHQAHDILTAIRLGKEFNLKMVLEGGAEAYLVLDQIKASGYPVILHPTMERAGGETANISRETASKLRAAGIQFAIESGFEGYVPKTRVVLFEAGMAAANGLSFEQALASISIDAAEILNVADRVGSLEVGKDGDVALYDGDPFELTSHCVGVVLNGVVVSVEKK
jgi:imidazolonepropionase-like amidohydrolase